MMPAQHYARAEELLSEAGQRVSAEWFESTGERKADLLAEAQVHATLATVPELVASTPMPCRWRFWQQVPEETLYQRVHPGGRDRFGNLDYVRWFNRDGRRFKMIENGFERCTEDLTELGPFVATETPRP